MAIRNKHLIIDGMRCVGCENIISEALGVLPGVHHVKASYAKAAVDVEFDEGLVDEAKIRECIEAKGYAVETGSASTTGKIKRGLTFFVLLVLVGGVAFWGKSQMPGVMQQIKPQMSYAVLLGIGFLTGFHCIGMCGGFVVAYTDPAKSKIRQLLAHLSYAFGKTLSYTVLGAGFGWLGATIAITPQIRGGVALAASVFLLIYGLKMLNVFGFLLGFSLRLPKTVNRAVAGELRKPSRSALRTGSKARLNSGQKAFEFRTGNNRIFGLNSGRVIIT